MPELKPGDTATFDVEGKTLVVEPIPFGNLKKLLKIIMEITDKGKKGDQEVLSIPMMLDHYADQVIPLLFRKNKHEFLTSQWVDENLTVPKLKEILHAASAVNGFPDFLGKRGPEIQKDLIETPLTPSESSGSTTPLVSPTDGGQGK